MVLLVVVVNNLLDEGWRCSIMCALCIVYDDVPWVLGEDMFEVFFVKEVITSVTYEL